MTRSIWSRLDSDERFAAIYLLFVALYAGYCYLRRERQRREADRARQRDEFVLKEEALQRLESGGTLTANRWHGGELTLGAEEVVVDATRLQEPDAEDES